MYRANLDIIMLVSKKDTSLTIHIYLELEIYVKKVL